MEGKVLLSEWIDMGQLMEGIDAYIALIQEKCDVE